jgi:DNA replication protein DnaC
MISPETHAQIRRCFYAEHWKVGTIASELGLHADTVRNAREAERFRGTRPLRASIVDPWLGFRSAVQLLEQVAQIEIADRARRSLERRLRLSGIKRFKPMADFDWSWPTLIERDVIERALTPDFVPEARNLVLVGRNGLGKTMIAQNMCHAAVLAGHSVLFRSAAALLEELHRQTPEGRRRKLRTYANVGILGVDEVGYLSFDDKAADLLYEVINRRYERKPVILTTNRPFKEWNEGLPERDLHCHPAGPLAASRRCHGD